MKQEVAYSVEYIPCSKHLSVEDRAPLEEWRRKICSWSFRVIDHFRLDRDIVAHGLNLLDRFLVSFSPLTDHQPSVGSCPCPACKRAIDGETFQLAAMTCIYLAIKLHVDNGTEEDFSRRKYFKMETFVDLSRGLFNVCDLCCMEQSILHCLEWKISTPTPMTFVNYFLTIVPDRESVSISSKRRYDLVLHVLRELARYLTELAVSIGGECIYCLPSQIAFSSILVSMELLTLEALPQSVRNRISRRVLLLASWKSCSAIDAICTLLKSTLWPDMLLDDGESSDPGHPISMARQCGILSLDFVYRGSQIRSADCPPGTPPRKQPRIECGEMGSPVGVDKIAHIPIGIHSQSQEQSYI